MPIPITQIQLLERIARETARMSYPGSMSRGIQPVVTGGTKAKLEEYFTCQFPTNQVWASASSLVCTYDCWHKERTEEIVKKIQNHVAPRNQPAAVASKFLNTFMYQLMKYEPCRPLLPALHLPLDARVFSALRRLNAPALKSVQCSFRSSPYVLSYAQYQNIQSALFEFVKELNLRPQAEFKVKYRIELNWLWL